MKKILLAILIMFSLVLASCGEKDDPTPEDTYYNVIFENTTIENKSIKEGEKLQKPADPQAEDAIFGGWYMDSGFNQEVEFPLTVNSDITIYAKFYTYVNAFESAREKTIGSDVPGYEYSYQINVTGSYMQVALTGSTVGSTIYSTVGEVKYYDQQVNSGILFNDGSKYQIRHGDVIQKISLNEDNEVTKFESTDVSSDFTYDTSSFAKALFEYKPEQLKSIEKLASGEYKLNTSMNFSSVVEIVGNNLNHPVVESIIGSLPETSAHTEMYVTFDNGEIKTYRYVLKIDVSDLTFNLEYKLTFKNVGVAQEITPVTFDGLFIYPNEIAEKELVVRNILNAFKNSEHSSYDFNVNTGLDFGATTSEINATFAGSTMRKVQSDIVFFHNDIEIDSDLKNGDLYKDAGISDIHIKKTMLSNKEVHIIEKKLLIDSTYLQDSYNRSEDDYYLFDIFSNIQNINYIQTKTTSDSTIYSIGVSSGDVNNILKWLNKSLGLDPLKKATFAAQVFGEFDESSVQVEELEIKVEVKNNKLSSIFVSSRGMMNTKYTNSRDFSTYKNGEYDFTFEIVVTDDGNSFEPFEDVKSAK